MNNEIEYKQVSVRLKPELYSRLEKLAKTTGLKTNELLRFWVYQKLDLVDNQSSKKG